MTVALAHGKFAGVQRHWKTNEKSGLRRGKHLKAWIMLYDRFCQGTA